MNCVPIYERRIISIFSCQINAITVKDLRIEIWWKWLTTISNEISLMKTVILWSSQVLISKHWFRWWFGTKEATNYHLTQWWTCSLMPQSLTQPQWVNIILTQKHHIQQTLDIQWHDVMRYCTWHNKFEGKTLFSVGTHERQPNLALMGKLWVSFVRYLEKIDHDISGVHCTTK